MRMVRNIAALGVAVGWGLFGAGFGAVSAQESTGQPVEGEKPAAPTAMTTPVMPGPLTANPNPMSFDLGPLGPVYLTGVVSPLFLWQKNTAPGDQHSLASL